MAVSANTQVAITVTFTAIELKVGVPYSSDYKAHLVISSLYLFFWLQFDECLYIALNGDGEEKEDDLRRKLYVVKKMIDIMFGMVTLSGTLLRKE